MSTLHAASTEVAPWIRFDIEKVKSLRESYLESIAYTRRELPKIKWESPGKLKEYFKIRYGIVLENATIRHLQELSEKYEHIEDLHDTLQGVIYFLKLWYAVVNYLDCILRHEKEGVVTLREVDFVWKFPNKQPLPYSGEIWACVTGTHESIAHLNPLIAQNAQERKNHGSNS